MAMTWSLRTFEIYGLSSPWKTCRSKEMEPVDVKMKIYQALAISLMLCIDTLHGF